MSMTRFWTIVRDGRVELTDDVVVLWIRANDIIADHVNAAQTSEVSSG